MNLNVEKSKQGLHDMVVILQQYFCIFIYNNLQQKIILVPPTSWLLPCVSLRPSCPALFFPQPNTAPDRERAKLWSPPAVIWAKGIPARDFRGWGKSLLGSSLPRPSCPLVFWPQVNSSPSEKEKYWFYYISYICTNSCNKTQADI